MINPRPDHDNRDDRDHDHANDNNTGRAIAPAPAGGALTSLAALGAALNSVDTASVGSHSGLPMLAFKRDGGGSWMYGRRRTIAEEGSRWAVNPLTFKWGYIAFGNNNKVLGERIVSVTQPKPEVTELPDKGAKWQEQWAVNLKCIDGTDAGVEVIFKPTTVGGKQAVAGLIDAVRDRLNGGHDGKVSPIVHLEKDSYQHVEHGKVWFPLLTVIDWMPLSGPAPAPEPASPPPPAVQPRRRRVA